MVIKIPPHLTYVATLPCEPLMSAKQAISDKLQGSTATYLRRGEVFNKQIKNKFIYESVSIFLNRWTFGKVTDSGIYKLIQTRWTVGRSWRLWYIGPAVVGNVGDNSVSNQSNHTSQTKNTPRWPWPTPHPSVELIGGSRQPTTGRLATRPSNTTVKIYSVSPKRPCFYFLNNSVKKQPILIIFGTFNPEKIWPAL